MTTEFNTGTDASLNEAVKSRYEANGDTNAFTDAEKSKLAGLPFGAEPNAVVSVNGQLGAVSLNADDIDDDTTAHKFATAAQLSKVDSVETGATADQSGSEIVSAINTELGGAAWQSGGGGGGGSTDVVLNVAQDRILGRISTGSGDSEELTAANVRSLLNVEDGATADQTGAEIKALYESENDTNALTDAEKSKLARVANGATANTGALADADTVDTAQIEDGAVTLSKMGQIAADRFLGRGSAGTGDVEVLSTASARAILNVLASTTLASTAVGEGASLVGISDVGGFTAQADVEGALQEIFGMLGAHGDIVTQDTATFVLKSEREVIVFDAGGSNVAARPTQASNKTVIWFNHGSQLPDNMDAFDIAMGQGFGVANINLQAGAAYTLALGDQGYNVDMTHASANTVTIPTNASVGFAIGTVISVTQLGAGVTTVSGDAGVSVNGVSVGSVSISAQYAGVVLRKIATDDWIAQGAIT